jgi:hypothetical protein
VIVVKAAVLAAGLVVGVVPKNPAVPPVAPITAPSRAGSLKATPTDFVLGIIVPLKMRAEAPI